MKRMKYWRREWRSFGFMSTETNVNQNFCFSKMYNTDHQLQQILMPQLSASASQGFLEWLTLHFAVVFLDTGIKAVACFRMVQTLPASCKCINDVQLTVPTHYTLQMFFSHYRFPNYLGILLIVGKVWALTFRDYRSKEACSRDIASFEFVPNILTSLFTKVDVPTQLI